MTQGGGSRRRSRVSSLRLRRMGRFDPDEAVACHYCGVDTIVVCAATTTPGVPWPPDMRTRDHVVPRAVGGLDKRWNVVIACNLCNATRTMDPACGCEFCVMAWKLHRAVGAVRAIEERQR